MNIDKLKENSPRSFSKLKEFLREKVKNSLHVKATKDEYLIEFLSSDDHIEEQIKSALTSMPRSFFDFFDSEGIYIRIEINETPTVKFSWNLSLLDNFDHYNTRKEAESKAIEEAFLTLERKLSED